VVDWGRARGRAGTWPERQPAIPWTPRLPDLSRWLAGRVAPWAAAEVVPGRLMPWLPVAFGLGIILYFAAEHEPAWWAGIGLAATLSVIAVAARRRPVAFPAVLAFAAMAAGFSTATLRTIALGHPVLRAPAYNVNISGFVEVREERERTDRIVVRIHSIEAQRLDQLLDRVRLSVKKGTAPPVGTFIVVKAQLKPPLPPLRPGGYDFARDLYFHGIGASGIALLVETLVRLDHANHADVANGQRFHAPHAVRERQQHRHDHRTKATHDVRRTTHVHGGFHHRHIAPRQP